MLSERIILAMLVRGPFANIMIFSSGLSLLVVDCQTSNADGCLSSVDFSAVYLQGNKNC